MLLPCSSLLPPFVFPSKYVVVAMGAMSSTIPAFLLLLTSFLFISALPRCMPLSFSYNFSDPATFNRSDITTDGDASLRQGGDASLRQGGLIELTQNAAPATKGRYDSAGRATYAAPVPLWDKATGEVTSFTTRFSFAVKSSTNETTYAPSDGLAFFLSPYPSKMPPSVGGGYLGLFNGSTAAPAAPAVVAVEFDTYQNEWDPSSDHVGIDVNSINSTAVELLPAGTLAGCSEPMVARVSYNSSTKLLAVALQLGRSDGGMRYELNSTVDLKSLLHAEVAIGFSAASGWSVELHRVLTWSFSSTLAAAKMAAPAAEEPRENAAPNKVQSIPSKNIIRPVAGAAVVAVIISVAVVGVLIWFLVMRRRRMSKQEYEMGGLDECSMDDEFEHGTTGPRRFLYGELAAATNNFAEDRKLGEGGFGSVYRGSLSDPGLHVAVKRISKSSQQGRKEYVSEVTIISQLRHRNLVQLVGWCHRRGGEFLLVYELVPNGSLDAHLYGTAAGSVLTWPSRYGIALGLGSALLYLHAGCDKCVVHRDVKPSNIMLDASFGAKLGDFGLAELLDHGSSLQTTALAGTMGYMDPEYAASGRAGTASDVYSFGVVLLEICCGRRPVLPPRARLLPGPGDEPIKCSSLLEWVWDLYGRGAALEAADERLDGGFDRAQMQRVLVVGLWCAHPDRAMRPSIKQALGVLQFEAPLPVLPPRMPVPTYSPSVVAAGYGDRNPGRPTAGSSAGDSSGVGLCTSSRGGERSTSSSTTIGPSSCSP